MEHMGICHTKRGLGTFVNEDELILSKLRHTSSQKLLSEFVDGMMSIGYTHDTLFDELTNYLKNNE